MSDEKPEQIDSDDLEQFENDFTETLSGEQLHEDEPDPADQAAAPDDTDEPTGDPVAPGPTEEPEPVSTEPEPKLYKLPDDDKFGDLRGQKATAAQLEEAGLLDTLLTWGHQGLGFQQKFQEIEPDIKAWRDYQERMTRAEEERKNQPEPQRELSKEEIAQMSSTIETHFRPLYDKAVENGAIEPELVEFAPKFLTGLEYRLQAGQRQLNMLFEAVTAFAEDYMGRAESATVDSGGSYLHGIMDEVSKVEGLESLGTDGVREQFVDWFASDKNGRGYELMETKAVTNGLMEDAYWAFIRSNPGAIADAAPASSGGRKPASNGRKLATGGGSSRGATGSKTPQSTTELDDFERDFNETSNERY